MKLKQDNDEDYIFIEASAGSGNFSQFLPSDRMIAMDIETKNYLTWEPKDEKKYCTYILLRYKLLTILTL